jgi:acetyl esterase/lipase
MDENKKQEHKKNKTSLKLFKFCLILSLVIIICIICGIIIKPIQMIKSLFQNNIQSKFNVSYGDDKNQKYDFYAPEDESDMLLIIVHGGGWVLGDKIQFSQAADFFSKYNISVINMNYRLAPDWKYDSPLQDISIVLKEIDSNKKDFNLNDDYKIVLLGHSAGAHLVSLYSLNEQDYGTKNIDYCIGLAGPYDLTKIYEDKDKQLIEEALNSFLDGTSPEDVSPVYQITNGEQTKFLLMIGNEDELVSADQMYSFEKALKDTNTYIEAYVIAGRNHNSLINQIQTKDGVAVQIFEFVGK